MGAQQAPATKHAFSNKNAVVRAPLPPETYAIVPESNGAVAATEVVQLQAAAQLAQLLQLHTAAGILLTPASIPH